MGRTRADDLACCAANLFSDPIGEYSRMSRFCNLLIAEQLMDDQWNLLLARDTNSVALESTPPLNDRLARNNLQSLWQLIITFSIFTVRECLPGTRSARWGELLGVLVMVQIKLCEL
jgi:hypothetical protein